MRLIFKENAYFILKIFTIVTAVKRNQKFKICGFKIANSGKSAILQGKSGRTGGRIWENV